MNYETVPHDLKDPIQITEDPIRMLLCLDFDQTMIRK